MGTLIECLRGVATTRRPLWIDYADYARRLFAPAEVGLWADVAATVHCIGQAQALLASDVVEIPLGAVVAAQSSAAAAVGGSPARRIGRVLSLDPVRRGTESLIDALSSSLRGQPGIALRLPSPRQWLAWIAAEDRDVATWDADDEEAVAVYLAGFLRSFADCRVDGILVDERGTAAAAASRSADVCAPLMNLAAHYRWSFGVQLDAAPEICPAAVQFVIAADTPQAAGDRTVLWGESLRWDSVEGRAEEPLPLFSFISIPADALPEQVLDRLTVLRTQREGQAA